MERASYVTEGGLFRVVKKRVGRERVYVVTDCDGGAVWPPDMPGVDELWEARIQADRAEAAAMQEAPVE